MMKPAGRSYHVVDRLGKIYVHRAARHRRMPSINLSAEQGFGVAQSLAGLDLHPELDELYAAGNARIFGIPVTWKPT